MSDPKPSVSEAVKQEAADLADAGKEVATAVIRKASPLTIGIAVVLAVFFAGLITLLYLGKDTILKVVETSYQVDRLKADHDHCHTELTEVKAEVRTLRSKVERLESKVATN